MSYRAIFLDFDNVILESVDVKTKAFTEVFAAWPECQEAIVRHHLENKGVSRYDKFRYIYRHILRQPLTEEKFRQLCVDFEKITLAQVLKCPYVRGAKKFLEQPSRQYDLYISSGTPQEEMRAIVAALGIGQYFAGIYGSPAKKAEHVMAVIADKGYRPGEILYVGDAMSDYEAARAVGCDFIGRVPPGKAEGFEGMPGVKAVLPDLTRLKEYL